MPPLAPECTSHTCSSPSACYCRWLHTVPYSKHTRSLTKNEKSVDLQWLCINCRLSSPREPTLSFIRCKSLPLLPLYKHQQTRISIDRDRERSEYKYKTRIQMEEPNGKRKRFGLMGWIYIQLKKNVWEGRRDDGEPGRGTVWVQTVGQKVAVWILSLGSYCVSLSLSQLRKCVHVFVFFCSWWCCVACMYVWGFMYVWNETRDSFILWVFLGTAHSMNVSCGFGFGFL